jgi:GTP-binding protein HflX
MSQTVEGNTKGLSPSQIRMVERLFARRFSSDEIVPLDVAREISRVASAIKRRVGMLVSREGRVEEVFVGSREILYLPDLGRYRLGPGRLRRLRLLFSDLSTSHPEAQIPQDHYTDLHKLRLDMVVSIKGDDQNTAIAYAHIVPPGYDADPISHTERVADLSRLNLNCGEFLQELETELQSAQAKTKDVAGVKAVLVGVYEKSARMAESSMLELRELARTAGVAIVDTFVQRKTPDPRSLLGKGKLEQVVLRCLALGAELLIFDGELKPGQWRIITKLTDLKVIDRSMLILDIFAQRATSSEGRLQVELAQHKYNLPRLVEKDTGLSRLSGGIGGRGPGETKLEIGRRRIRDRIVELERRIDKLGEQRSLRRSRRQERGVPLVAILGYTNVGKSTFFNALTQSTVLAENKLFATLDPAQRRVTFNMSAPDGSFSLYPAIISDTVGFIRDLPEELRNAFRSTLEELYEATVLVHVLDASDPEINEKKAAVEATLEAMELNATPVLTIVNKIDAQDPDEVKRLCLEHGAIGISALKRQGFEEFRSRLCELLKVAAVDPVVSKSQGGSSAEQ